MANVQLKCPSCNKIGNIEVSLEALNNVSRGLLAINVTAGIICSDSFVVYIDRNLHVRDYFVADFQIEIPELPISPAERFKETKIPRKEIVDIDLIKLNLLPTLLTYILKSIFSKQKIVLILDQEFLYNHIHNFFNYITQKTFNVDITIITKEDYDNNKKKYKDSIILERNEILRNIKETINPKKLFVEKYIINRFINEPELGYSYIFLKNEILKAYELSKKIVDFINESKEKNEKVNTLKIKTELEELYDVKINTIYLNFLIEIVKNYFGADVPSITDSFLEI